MKKAAKVARYTAGEMVRNETGELATVIGYDDRGYLDVLRADGLRVVWLPERAYRSRVYDMDRAR